MKNKVSSLVCKTYDISVLAPKVSELVELAGGFPQKVLDARTILIKPNLLTAHAPEDAVTTHPNFVLAVVRLVRQKNPNAEIWVGDSPGILRSWEDLWGKTGLTAALANEKNVRLIPFDELVRVELRPDLVLPVAKPFVEADAVISLPKLKTHILTKVTAAVKNSYGFIVGEAKSSFHGRHPSPKKMSLFLGEAYAKVRPDFIIMDAILGMEGEGPSSGHPVKMNLMFAAEDGVAMDALACRAFGYKPADIPLLVTAAECGIGEINLEKIEAVGDGFALLNTMKPLKRSKSDLLHRIPNSIFNLASRFLRCTPTILKDKCAKCGQCAKVCSQCAITKDSHGGYKVDGKKCILCVCCIEVCRYHAIEQRAFWVRLYQKITHPFTRTN